MTRSGLRALREGATLTDAVPTVRIRLRAGDRHLCTVASAPSPDVDPPAIGPATFRAAVGRLWRLHGRGAGPPLPGFAEGGEPAVDVGLRTGDAILPGDIYRTRTTEGRLLFCFLTELGVPALGPVLAEARATPPGRPDHAAGEERVRAARRVGLHADPVTDLVAVHSLCPPEDGETTGRLMGRLLEVCVAAEAIAEVASGVSRAGS